MVIVVEPVINCVESLLGDQDSREQDSREQLCDSQTEIILLTPQGEQLNQPLIEHLAEKSRIVMLCGRYEGFDQRVTDILQPREVSIGTSS